MSMEKILSYDAKDGMTLGELHTFIGELIAEGFDPESEIKIRTFFKADRHGAKVKKVTVVDKKKNKKPKDDRVKDDDETETEEPTTDEQTPVV